MVFAKGIRFGAQVADPAATLRAFESGFEVHDTYVIYINYATASLMEIVRSSRLFHQQCANHHMKAIAIANGRQEALLMIREIISEHLDTIQNAVAFKSRF